MSGLADIHHHILYGLDDGPTNYAAMTEMLKAAHANGVTAIVATPHTRPGIAPFDEVKFWRVLGEANDFCAKNALNLTVYPGCEILITPMIANILQNAPLLTLADTRYVLIEYVPGVRFHDMLWGAKVLVRAGYFPILAHMERYRCLRFNFVRIARLRRAQGVLLQMNCSTAINAGSRLMKIYARFLLKSEQIDFIASDAHDVARRKCRMREARAAVAKIASEAYARRVTTGILDKM